MSPTARALAELRKLGATACIVEKWIPMTKQRLDAFGFGDILAILGPNIILVQVTSGANHATRRKKILANPAARHWLEADGLLEVWSYSKTGKAGERKLWTCRKEAITLEDLR